MYLQGNKDTPTLSFLKLSPELFILPVQCHSANGKILSLAQPKKCNKNPTMNVPTPHRVWRAHCNVVASTVGPELSNEK